MNITQKATILLEGTSYMTRWVNGSSCRVYAAYSPGVGIFCTGVVFDEGDENQASKELERQAMRMMDNMIADKTVDSSVMNLVNIFEKMLAVDFDNDLETFDDFIDDVIYFNEKGHRR
jgi:hypothetical protein